MGHPPEMLTCPVGELTEDLRRYLRDERWLDAALAAAAIWQAADDALARTSSPVTAVAGRVRRRTDPLGRPAGLALDATLHLQAARTVGAGRRRLDRWREAVMALAVEAAVLATRAPGDAEDRPAAQRAARLAEELGEAPRAVRAAVTRIPSSFRSFDQHPDDVAALVHEFATRWPERSRPVVVVGVRTSGSHLAPFAVAALRRAGFSAVSMVSARPDQRLARADSGRVRAAAREGAVAMVVDDPPDSGTAVSRVCAEVTRLGMPPGSVVATLALFDESPRPWEALSPFPSVTLPWSRWSIHRRLSPERTAQRLAAALPSRAIRVDRELPVAAGLPRSHTRRLYRVEVTSGDGRLEVRTVLAAGTGLGFYGEHDVAVAAALGERVPAVIAHADGVVYLDWPAAARSVVPRPSQVAEYVAARHDVLGVEDDPSGLLRGTQPVWEVASNHVARVYGKYWPVARIALVDRLTRRLLRTSALSVPDGDMRPSTWLLGAGGDRPLKTSFADRAFSNFDLFCLDDRFDVVGAAVHTGDAEYGRDLRAAYETRTDRVISSERWLLYELVHLWGAERLGGADTATVSYRKSQAMRRYLAEVLLGDAEDPGEGPVVALDVDGVLETDLLGFKAPTPASVSCLRALSAHGFRTVLVTGRSVDDVVELSDLFRLAGGAAEYGSVVYDRRAAATAPLVADDELAVLARLRHRLQPEPAVRIDPRHRFSVRASTVDGHQRLRTFVPAPAVVPGDLRGIFGEEQTDFVSARIDKVDGAQALLRRLGHDRPVLAVGDTAADVGLLGWAPLSVVPRHADARARAAATRVARRPYQAGLAHAVGSLIGHRPGGCVRCVAPEMTDDTRAMLRLLRVSEGSRLQALLRSVPLAWANYGDDAEVSPGAPPARYALLRRVTELAVTTRNATRLLAGARMADGQALGSLPAEAEASLQHARSAYGLPSSWALGERLTTVADVAVIEVRDGGELVAVLKLARSPAGEESLRQQQATMQQLAGDPRLVPWRRFLPEVLAHGDVAARTYSIERAVPGTVGSSTPGSPEATEAAVRTIAEFHRVTGRSAPVPAALVDSWLGPALSLVADVPMLLGPTRRHRLVGLVGDRIREGLAGRSVWLARTHGDYFPGNVFFGPSAEVTGVIDWGQSREDDVALIDPMTLVLEERSRARRQGLGGAVRDLCRRPVLDDREAVLLEVHRAVCPADPVDVDVMALLAWLRHVENNLLKSPRYGAHPVWVRSNLEAVLSAVGNRAA